MTVPVPAPDVLVAGQPPLHHRARPFAPGEWEHPKWRFVFRHMLNLMRQHEGVGLAAPQVGINVRALVYQLRPTDRYPEVSDRLRPQWLLNPNPIEVSEETVLGTEGCLSYPGLRGPVPRARTITVRARNRFGEPRSIKARGFEARVLQHELDHLNGVLYPSRINHFDEFGYVNPTGN